MDNFDILREELFERMVLNGKIRPASTWLKHLDLKKKIAELEIVEFETYPEKLWAVFNNVRIRPRCHYCGGKTRYVNGTIGFRRYCSNKCIQNCPEVREKVKNTVIEHYGVEYVLSKQSPVRKEFEKKPRKEVS